MDISGFGKAADKLVSIFKDTLNILIEPAKKKAEAKAEMHIEKRKLEHKYELQKIDLIERMFRKKKCHAR